MHPIFHLNKFEFIYVNYVNYPKRNITIYNSRDSTFSLSDQIMNNY
jgi:hypothetical protein